MPCTISTGRLINCKDQVGGIQKVYFLNYTELTITTVDNVVTDLGTITVYEYDVQPETASLSVAINSSKENGTTFFEQTSDLTLHKLTAADEDNVRLLAWGRPQIFVLDNNNQVFLLGALHGNALNSGTIQTGTAFGDMSGYQLSFTGKEQQGYYQFPAASVADPFSGLSSTVTIVQGT